MAKVDYKLLGIWNDREYYSYVDPKNGGTCFAERVPAIREAIRAAEGWKIVGADYSQIEVKIMAFLSQDPWLIEAINSVDDYGNHKDIHSYMCCEINGYEYTFFYDVLKKKFKHPECRKYNETQLLGMHDEFNVKRGETKCVTFGLPYGAGEETVGKNIRNHKFKLSDGTIGLEPMERAKRRARELMESYFAKAWKLQQWLNEQKGLATRDGETRSVYDRRRLYQIPDQDDPERSQKLGKIGREAGNQPIQSSNADIVKMALRNFYKGCRGGTWTGTNQYLAKILLAVHDEIVATTPQENAERVGKVLEEAMTDAYNSIEKKIDGKLCYLKDIWNNVDVVIADYWTKEA